MFKNFLKTSSGFIKLDGIQFFFYAEAETLTDNTLRIQYVTDKGTLHWQQGVDYYTYLKIETTTRKFEFYDDEAVDLFTKLRDCNP